MNACIDKEWKKIKLIFLCCFSLFLTNVSATVRLPHLFSDHMVIQRDQPVKIWGWADKSETIEIVFGSQSKKVKADKTEIGHYLLIRWLLAVHIACR